MDKHRHCISDGLGTKHADCYEHEHRYRNTVGHFHGTPDQRRVFYTNPNTHPKHHPDSRPDSDEHAESVTITSTHGDADFYVVTLPDPDPNADIHIYGAAR